MKTKIVIWGTNENDEKVLLGIDLIESENKVNIYVFPESEATEVFYNQMINEWREDNPVVLPDNHILIERPLSVTDSLLPDHIKVTRTDVINRAKAEWHFVVLSSKLYELYKTELTELREKVSSLNSYDKNIWEELKNFWQKVQKQMYDKALFREHAKDIQEETNELFDKMKAFRKKWDEKFKEESKEKAAAFHEKLDEIRIKINEGLGLQPLWNEMKKIQSRFRNERLAKQDKNELWNKIDKLFKDIKEKKYGPNSGGKKNALDRIENRYKGLLAAIKKMENSIKWDKKDMKFQEDRAEGTFGQLERELRGAKLKMIEERVNSKEAKLADMLKTKEMLESKIEVEKEKARKAEEAEKIKAKEEELKAKVKEEIAAKNAELDQKMSKVGSTPEAVVDKIVEETVKAENDGEDDRSIPEKVQDIAEDVVDTAKAAAQVIKDRVTKAIDDLTEEE
ncbi:hypothetical protein [Portibacter marinus]|uniref:hypothetical protein n=1 Tax=Portibacter marinus TaxID=2898660 RepID=UPI001F1E14C7|nr:hypothetical protein [Portibacter marinus]